MGNKVLSKIDKTRATIWDIFHGLRLYDFSGFFLDQQRVFTWTYLDWVKSSKIDLLCVEHEKIFLMYFSC